MATITFKQGDNEFTIEEMGERVEIIVNGFIDDEPKTIIISSPQLIESLIRGTLYPENEQFMFGHNARREQSEKMKKWRPSYYALNEPETFYSIK